MAEPITFSLAAIAIAEFVGYSVGTHLIGGEAHYFYREFLERWREAPIDSATGLPRNHDLQQASEKALREAALVLVMELAGRIEPAKPWLSRLVEQIPGGGFLTMELFPGVKDPHRNWLEALRRAVTGERFQNLHRYLRLSEDDVRRCFAEGDLCAALGPRLGDAFLEWTRYELQGHDEPPDFEPLVRQGWVPAQEPGAPVALVQVYCLFFREHLKRKPEVFRILVTDTLNEVRTKLITLDASVAGALNELRAKIDALPATSPKLDFTAFEQWLEPQLGEIKDLLADVKTQLDALARGQSDLADKQGEILTILLTLNTEVCRGNAVAATELGKLREWLELSHAEQMAAHAKTQAGIGSLEAGQATILQGITALPDEVIKAVVTAIEQKSPCKAANPPTCPRKNWNANLLPASRTSRRKTCAGWSVTRGSRLTSLASSNTPRRNSSAVKKR